MTGQSTEDLLAALHSWAQAAAAAQLPVPSPAELAVIGMAGDAWAAQTLPDVAHAWAPTIDHLVRQVRLGVYPQTAAAQLPLKLRRPYRTPTVAAAASSAGGTDTSAPGGAPDDASARPARPAGGGVDGTDRGAVTAALIEWRRARIADGVEGADAIKDVTLRNLVKYRHTAADQIRMKLPGPAAALAEDLAAEFARLGVAGDSPREAVGRDSARSAGGRHAGRDDTSPDAAGPGTAHRPGFAPVPAAAADSDADHLALRHPDFCAYAFETSEIRPGTVAVTPSPDGVELTWEPWREKPGQTVIYRVVAGDDQSPYKPEAGDLIAATTGTRVADTRFLVSAVRHYQVWCHVGADVDDAVRNQPVLWAQGAEVSPVENMTLTEDEGRVIGQWTVFAGTSKVRVYRIPLDGGATATEDPRYQIAVNDANLTGFVDATVPRGRRFLYRALAEVSVDGSVRLSRRAQQEILVSVRLVPVEDLSIEITDENSQFDLRWSTPDTGTVHIYRFNTAPPAGLEREDLAAAALVGPGFTEDARIKQPVTVHDPTTSAMVGVPWPRGWDRAYLTPVTVFGDRVRVGTTVVKARPLPAVTDAQIVERFHTESVTFGWPAGAASVFAYIGYGASSPEEDCQGTPYAEISRSQHDRDGALTFSQYLPPNGCSVHLVPVAYSAAEEIRGQTTTLNYPGLVRLRYGFGAIDTGDPRQTVVQLHLETPTDIDELPALVLVNHAHRLPLEVRDGRHLEFVTRGRPVPHCALERVARGRTATEWYVDLTGVTGFIRLFVYEPGARAARSIALQDPSWQQLRLQPPPPPSPSMSGGVR